MAEQRRDDRNLVLHTLQSEEDAVDGLFEFGGTTLVDGGIVMRECASELGAERIRETLNVCVERVQERVEVLTRGVDALVVAFLVHRRPVARELADVGERVEQIQLGRDQTRIVARHVGTQSLIGGQQVSRSGSADVETGDECGEFVESVQCPTLRRTLCGIVDTAELHARCLLGDLLLTGLIDAQQCRSGVDLAVDRGQYLTHGACVGGPDGGFHLHRFEDDESLTRFDLVADGDRDGDDDGGCRCADQSGLVLRDLVADAVDLDEEVRGSGDGDHLVATVADDEAALVGAEAFDVDLQIADAVTVDAVAVRAGLADLELVGLTLVVQLDRAADGMGGARPAAACGAEERGALAAFLGVVGVDGRGDDGDVGDGGRAHLRAGLGAVEPAGVGGGGDDLLAVEQAQQKRFGGGAAVDDDGGLTQRVAQPRQRFAAVAAPGDDLGDHRVVVGRDDVALRDTGVDADAGAERELEQLDGAGSRSEAVVGVLGVEASLDGVAELGGAFTGQCLAVGDEDLQLHQVDAGGVFGDGVLDLEAGVDLEEREDLLLGLVQVLDGACALVAGGLDELGRGGAQFVGLLLGEQWGAGLLDDLLVAALDGAVAHARGPDVAVAVGDDLDLDVASIGDEPFEEDDGVAERALGLTLGTFEGQFEFVLVEDLADTAAAAAGAGLDDQRVADRRCVTPGVGAGFDGSAGPRCDGNADLLGEDLGLDLVAEQAHRVGRRADEGDVQARDEVGERRVLGDEAPADPHRVGTGLDQRRLEDAVVEVGRAARRLAQCDRFVGLADEHGPLLRLGVQRYGADAVIVFGVELSDGSDQAYCCLASVDYCNPLEQRISLRSVWAHRVGALDGTWIGAGHVDFSSIVRHSDRLILTVTRPCASPTAFGVSVIDHQQVNHILWQAISLRSCCRVLFTSLTYSRVALARGVIRHSTTFVATGEYITGGYNSGRSARVGSLVAECGLPHLSPSLARGSRSALTHSLVAVASRSSESAGGRPSAASTTK